MGQAKKPAEVRRFRALPGWEQEEEEEEEKSQTARLGFGCAEMVGQDRNRISLARLSVHGSWHIWKRD